MIRAFIIHNGVLMLQYAVAAMIPFILIPKVAGEIGMELFGSYAVVLAWGAWSSVIVQYAFGYTAPQMLSRTHDSQWGNVFFGVAVAKVVLLLSVGFFAVIGYFVSFRRLPSWDTAILFALPSVAAALNSVWFLQYEGRFLIVSVCGMVGVLLALAVAYTGPAIGMSVDVSAVMALVIAPFVSSVIGFLVVVVRVKLASARIDLKSLIGVFRGGGILFFSQFISAIYGGAGVVVIAMLISDEAAGQYSVFERVMQAAAAGSLLIHTVGYPKMVALYMAKTKDSYWRMVHMVILGHGLCVVITAVFVGLFREFVVGHLYGQHPPQYVEIMLALALVYVAVSVWGPLVTSHLSITGRADAVLLLTLTILFIGLVIGPLCVALFGITGWFVGLVASQGPAIYLMAREMSYSRRRSV